MTTKPRCGVFGWGIVAPRSPNVDAFAANLEAGGSWLQAFEGFGPNNFLVGVPEFDLEDYRPWIEERFPPRRYAQIASTLGTPTHYAIGAFIQALGQNPGLEAELTRLGAAAHVYIGTGVGDLETTRRNALALDRAQREWDRFWADPVRNSALARYLENPQQSTGELEAATPTDQPPTDPATVPDEDLRYEARAAWRSYWAARSPELRTYLDELRESEGLEITGDIERGRTQVIRKKQTLNAAMQKRWQAPEPPWNQVSAGMVWNIHNGPASQVSMLGRIHGLAFAPVAACATFGVALKLGIDAIRRGEAKAVVLGATDPTPNPIHVAAFYKARVISADAAVSKPLTGMRGTHVAGGAALWILGDLDHMTARGFQPLGWEPVGIGTSADAEHIITPSHEGPLAAIRQALADAGAQPSEVGTWDLHATATPGDWSEVATLREILPEEVLVTARKGTFGHGMSAGGGWELTAQYLGLAGGRVLPTSLGAGELNGEIGKIHQRFVTCAGATLPAGLAGKLSMGVGGVNACVVSRAWSG